MSGEIKVKVREGFSKDPRYKTYPYWYLEILGENDTTIKITPSYEQLKKMLLEIFEHERQVDISRDRKPDAVKWQTFINEVLAISKNRTLNDYIN